MASNRKRSAPSVTSDGDTNPTVTVTKVEPRPSSHPDSTALYARVHVNGLYVGDAEDDGWGGGGFLRVASNADDAVRAAVELGEVWAKTQNYEDDQLMPGESYCYEGLADYALCLAARVVDERRRKRLATKYRAGAVKKAFFEPGNGANELRWVAPAGPAAVTLIRKKYPAAIIYAELLEEEAVARYVALLGPQ